MIRFRNKILLAFAFLATSIFLSVSLGGEFLHQNIHHHESKASHDNCPVYQLLVQAFLFVVAVLFSPQEIFNGKLPLLDEVVISRQKYLLPSLREPPISL